MLWAPAAVLASPESDTDDVQGLYGRCRTAGPTPVGWPCSPTSRRRGYPTSAPRRRRQLGRVLRPAGGASQGKLVRTPTSRGSPAAGRNPVSGAGAPPQTSPGGGCRGTSLKLQTGSRHQARTRSNFASRVVSRVCRELPVSIGGLEETHRKICKCFGRRIIPGNLLMLSGVGVNTRRLP